MSRDKQIERHIAVIELTEILCGKPCDICKFYGQQSKCMPVYNAEKIADAGYRKASEVAREIFEEIEKILEVDKFGEAKFDVRELYKIEKKYTEGGENGTDGISS